MDTVVIMRFGTRIMNPLRLPITKRNNSRNNILPPNLMIMAADSEHGQIAGLYARFKRFKWFFSCGFQGWFPYYGAVALFDLSE